ncbi:DUF1501 domain-containing protein [Piscinibacter sakaiensis]|uniref:DUF1501 domain-containing protein n=1 Tax=Piscinibacter sakaiensis TaxID=1547922 RepID=UPI003728C37A
MAALALGSLGARAPRGGAAARRARRPRGGAGGRRPAPAAAVAGRRACRGAAPAGRPVRAAPRPRDLARLVRRRPAAGGARGELRPSFVALAEQAGRFLAADDGSDVAWLDGSGWDTHTQQAGRLGRLLPTLDRGLGALRQALGPQWARTTVLVMTEFGRTAALNGSGGTDHGTGGVERASPAERAEFRARLRERLEGLSAQERQALAGRTRERWQQMTPEERAQIARERRERLQAMSPRERRQLLEERRRMLDKLSPEEREALREKLP